MLTRRFVDNADLPLRVEKVSTGRAIRSDGTRMAQRVSESEKITINLGHVGQVRSLLDKRVGALVTVLLAAGALRWAKSLSMSSRIAFS